MTGIAYPTKDVLFTRRCGAVVDITYAMDYSRRGAGGAFEVGAEGDCGCGRGAYHLMFFGEA